MIGPPPAPEPHGAAFRVRTRDVQTLYDLAAEHRLYAVIDTAGDLAAYERVRAMPAQARCLYYGAEGARYAAVAPWLVQADADVCNWICQTLEVAAPDWGTFLVSRAAPAVVARQLRRWLTVRLPDGEAMRFRFYDPRVLFAFLRACTAEELRSFYGSAIEAFVQYDTPTQQLWVHTLSDATVVLPRRRVTLSNPLAVAPATPVQPTTMRSDAPFPLGLSAGDV